MRRVIAVIALLAAPGVAQAQPKTDRIGVIVIGSEAGALQHTLNQQLGESFANLPVAPARELATGVEKEVWQQGPTPGVTWIDDAAQKYFADKTQDAIASLARAQSIFDRNYAPVKERTRLALWRATLLLVTNENAEAERQVRDAVVLQPGLAVDLDIFPPVIEDYANKAKAGLRESTLRVTGIPAGIEIRVDDLTTPEGIFVLKAGTHHLRVRAEGYKPLSRSIELAAGETTDEKVALPVFLAADDETQLAAGNVDRFKKLMVKENLVALSIVQTRPSVRVSTLYRGNAAIQVQTVAPAKILDTIAEHLKAGRKAPSVTAPKGSGPKVATRLEAGPLGVYFLNRKAAVGDQTPPAEWSKLIGAPGVQIAAEAALGSIVVDAQGGFASFAASTTDANRIEAGGHNVVRTGKGGSYTSARVGLGYRLGGGTDQYALTLRAGYAYESYAGATIAPQGVDPNDEAHVSNWVEPIPLYDDQTRATPEVGLVYEQPFGALSMRTGAHVGFAGSWEEKAVGKTAGGGIAAGAGFGLFYRVGRLRVGGEMGGELRSAKVRGLVTNTTVQPAVTELTDTTITEQVLTIAGLVQMRF